MSAATRRSDHESRRGFPVSNREHDYYRNRFGTSPTFTMFPPGTAGKGSVLPLPYTDFLSGFAGG